MVEPKQKNMNDENENEKHSSFSYTTPFTKTPVTLKHLKKNHSIFLFEKKK